MKNLNKSHRRRKLRSFLSSMLNFTLMGVKQFFAYMNNRTGLFITGGIAIIAEGILTLKTIIKNKDLKLWRKIASSFLIFLSVVTFWGVILLFIHQPWFWDIHANEYISRLLFLAGCALGGYDILALILGTYPGLVTHKILVNLGNDIPWNDNRTDDPTGKTVGMKIFGKTIRLPRTTMKLRIIYSLISIGVMVFYYFHNMNLYV